MSGTALSLCPHYHLRSLQNVWLGGDGCCYFTHEKQRLVEDKEPATVTQFSPVLLPTRFRYKESPLGKQCSPSLLRTPIYLCGQSCPPSGRSWFDIFLRSLSCEKHPHGAGSMEVEACFHPHERIAAPRGPEDPEDACCTRCPGHRHVEQLRVSTSLRVNTGKSPISVYFLLPLPPYAQHIHFLSCLRGE